MLRSLRSVRLFSVALLTGGLLVATAFSVSHGADSKKSDAPAAPLAVPGKIGIVDIERAINETSAGKKMRADLQKEFDKKKVEFQKREGDLKKKFEDLEKRRVALSDEVRRSKEQEIQQEQFKFQKEVSESQAEIQKKQNEMLEPIAKKMESLIDRMGQDGGYSAVLDRRAVLWGHKSVDLTETVVKEFEKLK